MTDWEERAKSAGLAYIQQFEIGYGRRRCGKGFKFVDPDGVTVSCKITRKRLLSLVIPPAWKDVWICPDPDGHIQATGIDAAGRKQYIYHEQWHAASAAYKYGRLQTIASLLPMIRRKVQEDLKAPELTKRRVVAAVVRLLDKAAIRIGNKQYLDANDSRGATTLTSEHVNRDTNVIKLNFKGKSGQHIEVQCCDDILSAAIADCENNNADGFLFSYLNEKNESIAVKSSDVNSYLLELASQPITAKDFRTWRGSVIALSALARLEENLSKTAKKKKIVEAVKQAAAALGNTHAVCRSSYVHSAILMTAEEGSLPSLVRSIEDKIKPRKGLSKDEIRLMLLLPVFDQQTILIGKIRRARKLAA